MDKQDVLKSLKDTLVSQYLEDFGTHVSVNMLMVNQGQMTKEDAWLNIEKMYNRMMDKMKKIKA